jgi:hypothetical protein
LQRHLASNQCPAPLEARLREALQQLAADAESQESYLRRIGTWPTLDEVALDLDDVAEAAAPALSPIVRERVESVSRKLAEMSGESNLSLWEPEALRGRDWAKVRALAADALSALG